MRRVSATGQLWHDGHHYHFGYLVFDPAERFRPTSLRRIKNHSPNLTQKLN